MNKSYQQSLFELKSEVHYLRQRLSAMEEAQPNDDQDRPRKKAKGSRSMEGWYVANVSPRLMSVLTFP